MRLKFTPVAIWMLAGLVVRAGGADSSQTVELNGIFVLGGLRCAVLATDHASTTTGRSFLLTEGETQNGVRLLAVDAARHAVQIETDGQRQTLRLHAAPDLEVTSAAMEAAQAAASAPDHDGSDLIGKKSLEPVNTALIPGNPGWGTLPPVAPTSRTGHSTTAASSPVQTTQTGSTATTSPVATANPGAANAVTSPANSPVVPSVQLISSLPVSSGAGAVPQPLQSLPDWYVESQQIESDRIATEQQVLDHEMTALPRTPLTPPGTPDNLVDNVNGVYSNHNSDFLSQNWSQM